MALTKVRGDGVQGMSLLSTSTALTLDANGHITKPLQSAFQAHPTSDISNITAGGASNTDIVFGTERFDQNGDYNTSNGIFTAPVTGKYQFQFSLRLENIDTAVNTYDFTLITSNKNYNHRFDPDYGDSDTTALTINLSVLIDMDASDTAKVDYYQDAGSAQTDIDTHSYFSGYLVA